MEPADVSKVGAVNEGRHRWGKLVVVPVRMAASFVEFLTRSGTSPDCGSNKARLGMKQEIDWWG